MAKTFDVVILGGGIIGLSLARELSQAGRDVAVVDRGETTPIASWAASGILPPPAVGAVCDPLEQLRHYSHELYERWCSDLFDETNIDVEFERCGGIYLARTTGEVAALQSTQAQWQEEGVDVVSWTAEEMAVREPRLAGFTRQVKILFLPGEVQVRPSRILRALRESLARRRVTSIKSHWDGTVTRMGNRWQSVQTDIGELRANQFCITTGTWTSQVVGRLGIDVPIEPRRGQIVLWKLPQRWLHHVVNDGPRYLIARRDGHLLAGSTVEDVGFRNETTAEGLTELIRFAEQLVPDLRSHRPVSQWSGLRPMTGDNLPYLDQMPGAENVFLAAGHFRSGIHLAPATAKLLTQWMQGRSPDLSLRPFAIAR